MESLRTSSPGRFVDAAAAAWISSYFARAATCAGNGDNDPVQIIGGTETGTADDDEHERTPTLDEADV